LQSLTRQETDVLPPGGGIQATGGDVASLNKGAHITVAGLFIQLLFFSLFVVVHVNFHSRLRGRPTTRSLMGIPWEKHMFVLFAASLLVMVRSIFRVVEYLQGFDGYLLSHEVFLYIFDALLMFIMMALFNWSHPAEILSHHQKADRIGVPPFDLDTFAQTSDPRSRR
jgi:hypothetical protein